MAGVEQNRYKTNNGCIKHLPQTGEIEKAREKLFFDFPHSSFLCKTKAKMLKISTVGLP